MCPAALRPVLCAVLLGSCGSTAAAPAESTAPACCPLSSRQYKSCPRVTGPTTGMALRAGYTRHSSVDAYAKRYLEYYNLRAVDAQEVGRNAFVSTGYSWDNTPLWRTSGKG